MIIITIIRKEKWRVGCLGNCSQLISGRRPRTQRFHRGGAPLLPSLLLSRFAPDIRQDSLSNIYSFDIHMLQHAGRVENHTRQCQMVRLRINGRRDDCLKKKKKKKHSFFFSVSFFNLFGCFKRKRTHRRARASTSTSQGGLFASVSVGQC